MNFSVIIRCKNEERYIGHAIQSIIDLIPYNKEIIIIDNNSTDKSMEIVNLFKNEIDIKIFNIDEYTPGKSLNLGIEKSKYENILIMSSHCQLLNININKIENLLKSNISVWGKQIPIYYGKKMDRSNNIWKNFKDNDIINYYCIEENNYFLHNALSVFKKNTLIKNPFCNKIKNLEDRLWAYNVIDLNENIYYDSELVCNHYYTKNGSTWK